MSKHTAGPWKVDRSNKLKVLADRGAPTGDYIIAETSAWYTDTRSAEANASLIAAAPDLLEACYAALNIEGAASIGARDGALKGLDVKYHTDKIRAAIAKAEGR